jgi:nucleotide-binding universal stress UspA family protein
MFKNILVPLDGSALAAGALPFAKRLARAGGARLIVVRAYLPADDALLLRVEYLELSAAERADADRETATAEFQSAVDELRADGLDVEAHFVDGAAAGASIRGGLKCVGTRPACNWWAKHASGCR